MSRGTWDAPSFDGHSEPLNSVVYKDISDWKVVFVPSLIENDYLQRGFYAVAFQGKTKNATETVIAYRGSTAPLEILTDDGFNDWMRNDLPFQIGNVYTEQLDNALLFYRQCSVAKAVLGTNITVTGHSLGGALASMVTMVYNIRGEVFNPAYSYKALYSNKPEIVAPGFRGIDKWNLTNHHVLGDPVSGYLYEYTDFPNVLYPQAYYPNILLFLNHQLECFLHYDTETQTLSMVTPERCSAGATARSFAEIDLYLGSSQNDSFTFYSILPVVKKNFKLYGGEGNDTLKVVGNSSDVFVGGKGNNEIDGGKGDDVYYISKGEGHTIIRDSGGDDKVLLLNFLPSDRMEFVSDSEYVYFYCNGEQILSVSMNRKDGDSIKFFDESTLRLNLTDFRWGYGITSFQVACPTDVDILDTDGNVVLTLKNGVDQTTYTEYGNFYVFSDENGESIKYADMVDGYSFRIRGVGDGSMNVMYCKDGDEPFYLTDIPVTSSMIAVIKNAEEPQLSIDNNSDGVEDCVLPMNKDIAQTPCEKHTWNDGNVTTQPTHTEDGEMTYTCTACGQTKTEPMEKLADHVYDQEVTDEKYLASPATCEAPAIYFKSCICGEAGEETFEYGEPIGHSFSDEWSMDETHHWHKAVCEHENEVDGYEAHIWDGNICQVCGYTAQKQECTSTQETGIREGRFHLFVGNKDMGSFELAQSGNGWTIQDADGYLAVKSGKLVRAWNPFAWNYSSNRFYVTVRNSGFGSLLKPSTSWYLSANNNGLIVTTNKTTVSIREDVSAQAHNFGAWMDNQDGTHRRSCSACGEVETGSCTYDNETHLCTCGAYDPAFRSVSVSVSFDKRVTRILFIIRKVTYYAHIDVEASGTSVRKVEYSTTGGRTWKAGTTVSSNRELKDFLIRVTDSSGTVYRFTCRNGQVEAQ